MNQMKNLVLLAPLTALLLWAGHALGGQNGLVFALALAGVMNFGAYWFSDRMVLRMYGAQAVSEAEAQTVSRDEVAPARDTLSLK